MKTNKFEAKKFTPEELNKLRKFAEAFSRGYPTVREKDLSKEFGSYVVIEALEGRYKLLSWMMADFLRQEFGRIVDGKMNAHTTGKLTTVSLDADLSRKNRVTISKRESQSIPGHGDVLNMLPPDLTEKEHALMVLFFKWGLTQKELGEAFCVTESRICQVMAQAFKKIREAVK